MPRTPRVQNKVFFSSGAGEGAQSGKFLVAKSVQLSLALFKPPGSGEAGWLLGAKKLARKTASPALCCRASCSPTSFLLMPAVSQERRKCRGEGQPSSSWRGQRRASSPTAPWRGHPVSSSWALAVCLDLAVGECGTKGGARIGDRTC